MSLVVRDLAVCFLILLGTIANGAVRQAWLVPWHRRCLGHVVSTVLFSLLIFAFEWMLSSWLDVVSAVESWLVGGVWLVLTVERGADRRGGRLCRILDKPEAEFAVVVADRWQRKGLGGMLTAQLVGAGTAGRRRADFRRDVGENRAMRSVCERADFSVHRVAGGSELVAELNL
jgi:hypothetical protein